MCFKSICPMADAQILEVKTPALSGMSGLPGRDGAWLRGIFSFLSQSTAHWIAHQQRETWQSLEIGVLPGVAALTFAVVL